MVIATNKIISMFIALVGKVDINIYLTNYNSISLYDSLNKYIILPMGFIDKYKFNKSNICVKEQIIQNDISSQIILRDKQRIFIENIKLNNDINYVILQCPCGFGKTIIGAHLITQLKQKTLIITTIKKISEQWKKTLELTNLRVYYSSDGVKNILKSLNDMDKYDVIVCPDKHLKNEMFTDYVYNNYSMVFIDEVHSYNFTHDSNVNKFLYKYRFKYCIGLTATPSVSNKIHYHNIYSINVDSMPGNIYNIELLYNNTLHYENKYDKYNNKMTKLVFIKKDITTDTLRNNVIKNVIVNYNNENTRALILSEYREHVKFIYNSISHLPNVFLYDVSVNNTELFDTIDKLNNFILIATNKSSIQGLDIKKLNTLHILTPISNPIYIIQASGRINRDIHNPSKCIFVYGFSIKNENCNTLTKHCSSMLHKTLPDWNYITKYVNK